MKKYLSSANSLIKKFNKIVLCMYKYLIVLNCSNSVQFSWKFRKLEHKHVVLSEN